MIAMARRPDARSPFPQKEPAPYIDPTYEGIRAPKFYDFCKSEDEDGRHSGDSWFERNNGEYRPHRILASQWSYPQRL